jgi:predicted secreted protein
MAWQSALAIYLLFWVLALFLVLPFGVRTTHEAGEPPVPGQADSAPSGFSGRRTVWRTTLVSLVLFGAFYLNYIFGWVTPQMLDFYN